MLGLLLSFFLVQIIIFGKIRSERNERKVQARAFESFFFHPQSRADISEIVSGRLMQKKYIVKGTLHDT